MSYSPLGKFDSALDELLYTLAASEQWSSDDLGSVEDFSGYYWKLDIGTEPLEAEDLETVQRLAAEIDPDDTELVQSVLGHWVVWTDSNGFVYIVSYDSSAELDTAWTELESQWTATFNSEGQD